MLTKKEVKISNIKQKKFKHHDALLHWFLLADCNLNCVYCLNKEHKASSIDISSLQQTLEKTNKIFNISFTCSGETFFVPNFIKACVAITKKHYISLATNLTSPLVKEFVQKIDPQRVILIVASAHIKELKRKNLLETYFNNFLLLRNKGFLISATEVAHPSLLGEVEKYKNLFLNKDIILDFYPFIGKHNGKIYPYAYNQKELKIFDINLEANYQYKKKCNAGYNAGVVLSGGDIQTCLSITENLGNIYKEVKFKKQMVICPVKFCSCPLKTLDYYLFNKTSQKIRLSSRRVNLHLIGKFFSNNKTEIIKYFLLVADRFIGQIGAFLKNNSPKLYFSLKKIIK